MNALAWAAGFFDGEGYIGLEDSQRRDRPGRSFSLRLALTNTHEMSVRRMQALLGGTVVALQPRVGHLPAWQWQATNQVGLAALRLLQPYLVVKGAQANIAIDQQASRVGRNRPIGLWERLERRLAHEALKWLKRNPN